MSMFKGLLRPKADSTANDLMADVVGGKTDAAVAAVTTNKSLMGYLKGALNQSRKIDLGATGTIAAGSALAYLPRCVEKSDGALLSGNDDIFTIAGGPVLAVIVGYVTTLVVGASNGRLKITTTAPAATAELSAGAVAVDDDAAGTAYYNVGATSVFTPVTAGAVIMDPVTVQMTEFLLPPGTVHFNSSAARTGVIKWYMYYRPLSPNSLVTAAA